jgi:hypothetical protein
MLSANEQVNALHAEYCARTGFEITLDMQRERMWGDWLLFRREQRFGLDDLKLVLAYLRAGIRKGERNEGALKLRNLIGSPDMFEEDLALAKKWRAEFGPRRPSAQKSEARSQKPEEPQLTDEERREFIEELQRAKNKRGSAQP